MWAGFYSWKSSLLFISVAAAIDEGTSDSPLDFCITFAILSLHFEESEFFLKCNSFDVCHIFEPWWLFSLRGG